MAVARWAPSCNTTSALLTALSSELHFCPNVASTAHACYGWYYQFWFLIGVDDWYGGCNTFWTSCVHISCAMGLDVMGGGRGRGVQRNKKNKKNILSHLKVESHPCWYFCQKWPPHMSSGPSVIVLEPERAPPTIRSSRCGDTLGGGDITREGREVTGTLVTSFIGARDRSRSHKKSTIGPWAIKLKKHHNKLWTGMPKTGWRWQR